MKNVDKLKYNENDYIYGSARIRALENNIIGTERCLRMCDVRDKSELYRLLDEFGLKIIGDDLNSVLNDNLRETFEFVAEMIPNPELLKIQRYPYDCHNIKTAIKSTVNGDDKKFENLLYSFGTVSIDGVADAIRNRDFSSFPPRMAKAAEEAIVTYNETFDPQVIDIILDNSCYADMLETAKASGIDFLCDMVRTKVDLTNILTCIRISRILPDKDNISYLRHMLISKAGTLDEGFFIEAFRGGESLLSEMLKNTKYASLSELGEGTQLNILEKECEDFYMRFIGKAKYKITGIEVSAAYITAREYEMKNIRIIEAGKLAGLSSDVIKERVRFNYV